jgi:hypothetical protein
MSQATDSVDSSFAGNMVTLFIKQASSPLLLPLHCGPATSLVGLYRRISRCARKELGRFALVHLGIALPRTTVTIASLGLGHKTTLTLVPHMACGPGEGYRLLDTRGKAPSVNDRQQHQERARHHASTTTHQSSCSSPATAAQATQTLVAAASPSKLALSTAPHRSGDCGLAAEQAVKCSQPHASSATPPAAQLWAVLQHTRRGQLTEETKEYTVTLRQARRIAHFFSSSPNFRVALVRRTLPAALAEQERPVSISDEDKDAWRRPTKIDVLRALVKGSRQRRQEALANRGVARVYETKSASPYVQLKFNGSRHNQ